MTKPDHTGENNPNYKTKKLDLTKTCVCKGTGLVEVQGDTFGFTAKCICQINKSS